MDTWHLPFSVHSLDLKLEKKHLYLTFPVFLYTSGILQASVPQGDLLAFVFSHFASTDPKILELNLAPVAVSLASPLPWDYNNSSNTKPKPKPRLSHTHHHHHHNPQPTSPSQMAPQP